MVLNRSWQKICRLESYRTHAEFYIKRSHTTLSVNQTTPVRVRFAPSPTGMLHLGGLRTALFNYVYAKKNQGSFILRIEDTDMSRTVPGAVERMIDMLEWAGISYDEGKYPVASTYCQGPKKEGLYGPYIQSERLPIYQQHVQQLLDSGHAYKCFCTPERLQAVREMAKQTGNIIGYDAKCRYLTNQQIQDHEDQKTPFTVRLKIPSGMTTFQDLVRGAITFQHAHLDDCILLKSDGYPTYHLANVVDDHLMNITHVLRGEEWVSSTPKHILLYQSFQWTPPLYAHLPLLCNADGSKLSKRSGDVHVEQFKNKGYLPEAINNFTALLGWHSGTNKEFYKNIQELAQDFCIEHINNSSSIVSHDKLIHLNKLHILSILDSTQTIQEKERRNGFIRDIIRMLETAYASEQTRLSDRTYVEAVIHAVKERVRILPEFANFCRPFFIYSSTNVIQAMQQAGYADATSLQLLKATQHALSKISKDEWTPDHIKTILGQVAKTQAVKFPKLGKTVRWALTGTDVGIDLKTLVHLIGQEEIIARLKAVNVESN